MSIKQMHVSMEKREDTKKLRKQKEKYRFSKVYIPIVKINICPTVSLKNEWAYFKDEKVLSHSISITQVR